MMLRAYRYLNYKHDPLSTKIYEIQELEYNHAVEDILNFVLLKLRLSQHTVDDSPYGSEREIDIANERQETLRYIASEICRIYISEHDYEDIKRGSKFVRICRRCLDERVFFNGSDEKTPGNETMMDFLKEL